MSYPTTLDDAASLYVVGAGETILAAHHNILADRIVKLEEKIGIGLSNAASAAVNNILVRQADGSTLWGSLGTMAIQNANAVNITGGSISALTGNIAISGNVNATAFIGNGAGLTGIGSGTGGVINTGSTTIGADSDANGTGIISFQIGGVEKWAIGNNVGNKGYLGWETNAPTAVIDLAALPNPGSIQAIRFRSNEAGSGDFSFSYFSTAGSNGETRRDNQLGWGYNLGGPGYVSTEISFGQFVESRYKTSEGITQTEFYFVASLGSGGYSSRPFGMDFYHSDGSTRVGVFSNAFAISDPDDGISFVEFGGNTHTMAWTGDSGIAYGGTRNVIMTVGGGEYLYVPVDAGGTRTYKLFGGSGGSNTELNLFPLDNCELAVNYSIGFGSSGVGQKRRIRWNGTTQRWGYEIADNTFRLFNDWSDQIHHFGVNRSLGAAAGDYIEIGTLTNTANGDFNIEIEVFNDDLRTYKRFDITKTNGDTSGDWREVLPCIHGLGITGAGDVAIDVRNNGTGGHNLRLRRTIADDYGAQTLMIALRVFDKINTFTPSSASGSGATVAGIYRWVPWTMTPSGPALWDGAAIQTISIGAADSGGTGFRLLRIPN